MRVSELRSQQRRSSARDENEDDSSEATGLRFEFVLLMIVLFGLAWRVVYVIWMRHLPIAGDGFHYQGRAHELAQGHGFVAPRLQLFGGGNIADATDPPGWSVVLAAAIKGGLASQLSLQLVACAIGAATVFMTGLAGRAAFGHRTGLIAAGVAAIYPNVWIYERELMSEPLALLLVATCLWLVYRFIARPGLVRSLVIGIVIGLLALTRSEQFALLLFLVVPLMLWTPRLVRRDRIRFLAVAVVACIVVVAPWSVYNSVRFEHPVLLSTGLGSALSAGNCDATYSGELLGYYQSDTLSPCQSARRSRSINQAIADARLRHAAVDYMRAHAARVPIVVAARVGRTFNLFRPAQQIHLEAERQSPIWVLWLGVLLYWALVPLAALGGFLARRRRIPIYPLFAVPTVVVVSVMFTIGSVRYRAPAEIPLVLLAALALEAAARQTPRIWSDRRRQRTATSTQP